jgi:hypothetical protein
VVFREVSEDLKMGDGGVGEFDVKGWWARVGAMFGVEFETGMAPEEVEAGVGPGVEVA